MNAELAKVAWGIIHDCTAVKANEIVTVVTDLRQEPEIGEAFLGAALAAGADAALITVAPRENTALPAAILDALKGSDLVIFCSKLPFLRADVEATQNSGRTRVLSAFKLNIDTMVRTLPIDYTAMTNRLESVAIRFRSASQLTILGPSGARFGVSIKNRPATYVTGCVSMPGEISYCPGGVFASTPLEVSANGTFVVNGSTTVSGRCSPITCTVRDGRVVRIEGGSEARALEEHLKSSDDGAWWVAELGFGANPRARLSGSSEDERISAGLHIGIGHNLHLGGSIKSASHVDVVMLGQTLEIDGVSIIRNGEWV